MSNILWASETAAPYNIYDKLRPDTPVVWDDDAKCWLVTSFPLVREVMGAEDKFVQAYADMKAGDTYRKIRSDNPRSAFFMQGDKHKEFHRWWVIQLLSPSWVQRYKADYVEPVITQLLDELDGRTHFDIVADFADHIPVRVFVKLLDLPDQSPEAIRRVRRLNGAISRFTELGNSLRLEADDYDGRFDDIVEAAVSASNELNDLLRPIVADRRGSDGPDFISRFWQGGSKIFDDWNELDTLDVCRRLLFAGVDTTKHALSNAFAYLLEDADLQSQVTNGDSKALGNFVEELFRLNGSIEFRPRRAASDFEFGGAHIKQGDLVLAMLIAANRDPEQYGCAANVQLDRAQPKNHLAFGYGPRTCPGASLARAEVESAIRLGFARFPSMAIDRSKPAPALSGLFMRSYQPIHVDIGAG